MKKEMNHKIINQAWECYRQRRREVARKTGEGRKEKEDLRRKREGGELEVICKERMHRKKEEED